jgi:56kDa selenium binding protein (SBP56)
MMGVSMPRFLFGLALVFCVVNFPLQSQDQKTTAPEDYLFAWSGDADLNGNDFLAVIDADPSSVSYGHLVTTLATGQQTMRVHHTEYTMPASGMLFANDHGAGRTFIFDVRDPLRPKIVTSFTEMAGYMHPHSYLRLPNGNVLATFQHAHHGESEGQMGMTGGLVEIDDQGKVIRSASTADPAFAGALLIPYSLVVLPELDRIVSTNSSMHLDDIFSGVTYQVWRLSDLKLLKTSYFDVGENRYSQISPEEPRLGPDGSIFVQTLGCGLERITGVDTNEPKSRVVYTFSGNWCGVPTIVGHYLVQSVPAMHGLIVLDITNPAKPVEVSRLKLTDTYAPHWTAWGPKTQRLVVTSSGTAPDRRLYLLKLDQATGALTLDDAFRDTDGKAGFNFADREWPHAWKGTGLPHGAVFSR